MQEFEIRHAHFFCGLGGGAAGFNAAKPWIPGATARMRCIGGIDVDRGAIADFNRLTGVRGTVLDMFDRDQYQEFHGHEPPADWREATTADVHAAFGGERPHIVFLSAPCKGFSPLMVESKSRTNKYIALNRLTLRGIWLMLEAYGDDPPELIVFENVPLIATRDRYLLDQITQLLQCYGYVVNETKHDCGELGGLAQHRKRFLLVARHAAKVPPFLYEPARRPLISVGDVLGRMPLVGDVERGGSMHRVPSLQWKTWVRLAFVEAGSDWRSLNRLRVEDGHLRDFLIVPDRRDGYLGVNSWGESTGALAGASGPTNGAYSVADPRAPKGAAQYQQYGVMRYEDTSGAIIGVKSPGQGTFSIADPRVAGDRHKSVYRIVPWGGASGTITGDFKASGGGGVADPRPTGPLFGKYACAQWEGQTGTVIARCQSGQGAFGVADPRPLHGLDVADATRQGELPGARENLVCRILSTDGTWHRPFTTLEMACLQSLVEPEEKLELDGLSDQAWRERIGNAVPKYSATAIGEEMGRTLLLAWTGQTFALSNTPIWVRDAAVALALPGLQDERGCAS